MRKLLYIICFIFIASIANSNELLQNASSKISEFASGLIPGEGITEVNIELKDHEEPDFTILGVRDISKTNKSNFFTQFSLHNNDVGGNERYIGNLGLGYRKLNDDDSMIFGINSFYDRDLREGHARASIGLEAKASVLKFNLNQYLSLSPMKTINGVEEQSLGGLEYNLTSPIPYMPWTEFSWTGYKHNADKASQSVEGDIYTLGMALTPSLQLDLARDESNHEDGNADSININFIYPPRDNKPTLAKGFTTDEIWHKESMKDKLSEKVKRNNNLVVEIQGAVIITSK